MLNASFLVTGVVVGAFIVMMSISAVTGERGRKFFLNPRWLSKSLLQWGFVAIAAALSITFTSVYLHHQHPRPIFVLLVPIGAALCAVFLWAPNRNVWALVVAMLVFVVFYVYVYGSKLLS